MLISNKNWSIMDVLIDGVRYVKQQKTKTSIGIGITTHNRPAVLAGTVARILEHTPNAKIVIVDDASDDDIDIAGVEVYKFKTNVGIARAKNKCLELLQDYQHIFLFDDDTYPIADEWYTPYVNSTEPHLMYLFEAWASGQQVGDDEIIYEDGNIVAHAHARGCMLYIERRVLDVVGGMDVRYGKAMNEHLDWSNRIYNAGLTSFRYMDVPVGKQVIHSMDQYNEVVTSIDVMHRRVLIHENTQLLQESLTSTRYAPYGKDVVIACYFAGVPDAQRGGERWATDLAPIEKLKQSVEAQGYEFILIHNCFDLPNLTTISRSPYWERWLKEWQYLRDHPEINNVFVVDATDVDMLNNPFTQMQAGRLYVGDEPSETLTNEWMIDRHPNLAQWLTDNGDKDLLNCGVVGGNRQLVMDLCMDMYRYGFNQDVEQTEMGIFNKLMHTKYNDRIVYGRQVTTLFKHYEPSSTAWFRHK